MKLLPSIFYMLLSLAGIWISSGIKFRRTRKAFKTELLRSGLPSEVADSLVKSYADMRKELFIGLIRGARQITSKRSIFA